MFDQFISKNVEVLYVSIYSLFQHSCYFRKLTKIIQIPQLSLIHFMITLIKYVNQQIIDNNVNFHKLVDFMHNERLTSFMFIDAFY